MPFVVEVDRFQRLPGGVLINVKQVSMLAVEVRGTFASGIDRVPREHMVPKLQLEHISSRARRSGRAALRLRFPRADQETQRSPRVAGRRLWIRLPRKNRAEGAEDCES